MKKTMILNMILKKGEIKNKFIMRNTNTYRNWTFFQVNYFHDKNFDVNLIYTKINNTEKIRLARI